MSEETGPGFFPLSDQVLVRVLPLDDRTGKLWLPVSVDHGRMPIRRGVVVALGCGDMVAPKCVTCDGCGSVNVEVGDTGCAESWGCDDCGGTGFVAHERTSFSVQPGDEVLYHPRGWAHYDLDGTEYIVLHEDQGILAVLDETISFHPVRRSEARGGPFEGGTVSSHQ